VCLAFLFRLFSRVVLQPQIDISLQVNSDATINLVRALKLAKKSYLYVGVLVTADSQQQLLQRTVKLVIQVAGLRPTRAASPIKSSIMKQ
jgi:L-asparaginase/Glu-tRNA(Gln) amidotransferase subunit D